MVGGFPQRRPAPAKTAAVPTVDPDAVEFDEDGQRRITAPLTPAPPPSTVARPLPPMPTAPKPGALPQMPMRPRKPTVKREGPSTSPAATLEPTAVKRQPPPSAPYVRKPPARYLDPNDIPFDPPPRLR